MGYKIFGKRKYENKIAGKALENKEFLMQHLRREWEILEKQAKKESLVRAVKEGASTAALVAGQTLLTLLLVGGTLAVAAAAPNVIGAIGRIGGRRFYFHEKGFKKEMGYLKKRNYIKVGHTDKADEQNTGVAEIALTELGTKRAVMMALGELKMMRPDKWDGVWRMVLFDIPNRHRVARDGLRERLKTLGFYAMQESVFVYPYPCDEEIEFLTSLYSIGDYIRTLETSKITHDGDLRIYFNLK